MHHTVKISAAQHFNFFAVIQNVPCIITMIVVETTTMN